MNTTLNTLLDGKLHIMQPDAGYRVAVDPILLAAAVPVKTGQKVADFGCGTGAAALCLLHRCASVCCVGVELNPEHVRLAELSAAHNGMSDRLRVWQGNVRQAVQCAPTGGFDGVLMNPPYFVEGNVSHHMGKARANHEYEMGCADWIRAAFVCLKPKGHLTIIQAADRLQDVLIALSDDFGAVEVIPLWPKSGRDAKRVIVRAVKGRKTPLRIVSGLVLHRDSGDYTDEAQAILRDGAALDRALSDSAGKVK